MSYDICSSSVFPKINIKGGGTQVYQWYMMLDQQSSVSGRGHLQTEICTLNVIVMQKGWGMCACDAKYQKEKKHKLV